MIIFFWLITLLNCFIHSIEQISIKLKIVLHYKNIMMYLQNLGNKCQAFALKLLLSNQFKFKSSNKVEYIVGILIYNNLILFICILIFSKLKNSFKNLWIKIFKLY